MKNGSDGERKTSYGFKAHSNVEEDGFIKTHDYSAGNAHDSKLFESLFTGSEKEVYADRAYQSKNHKNRIKEKGLRNRVLERVFGVLNLHYCMAKARYLGQAGNRARFALLCLAYNMQRGVSIQQG